MIFDALPYYICARVPETWRIHESVGIFSVGSVRYDRDGRRGGGTRATGGPVGIGVWAANWLGRTPGAGRRAWGVRKTRPDAPRAECVRVVRARTHVHGEYGVVRTEEKAKEKFFLFFFFFRQGRNTRVLFRGYNPRRITITIIITLCYCTRTRDENMTRIREQPPRAKKKTRGRTFSFFSVQ